MKIQIGSEIPPWDMPCVLPERMRTMAAVLRDPYPVHWDRKVVAAMGLGERTINQGPLGLSYMINMLHAWAGYESIKRLKEIRPREREVEADRAGTEAAREVPDWDELWD